MTINDELNLIVTDNDIGYKDKMQAYLNVQAQNYIDLRTKNLVAVGNSATGSDQIISDLGANYSTQEALIAQTIKISSANANDTGADFVSTITDIAGAVKASGTITFALNAVEDDTITINGVTFTFKNEEPTGNQILIGADLAETLQNTIEVLNASEEADVAKAVYTVVDDTILTIVHKNYGTGGNAFTIAASVAVASDTVLENGANGVGSILFTGNLDANDTLTINGTVFTIVASGATGNQINKDSTLSATLDNIVTALNASTVTGVALATYSKTNTDTLTITFDDSVDNGEDFLFSAVSGGGTGARTVLLSGYDVDYNEQSEIITLNGQTAVNTTKKYILVRELEVLTTGTGNTNAGTVYAGVGTVTSGAPATKYLGITAGVGITRAGFYLVPAGCKMIIKKSELQNRTATNACLLKLWTKKFGGTYVQKYLRNVEGNSITSTNIEYVLPEKTLIKITGNNETSTSAMIINMGFYLVKK